MQAVLGVTHGQQWLAFAQPWCVSYILASTSEHVSLCVQVDVVIGADGANSRVAKEIDAGEYDYAIAFQERIRIPDDKMDYYKDLAEMYVGDDVSPDFYGWVFPKYDHVAVGTGTVVNKTAIKKYQQATRDRSKVCMHVFHDFLSHIARVLRMSMLSLLSSKHSVLRH